MNRRSDRVGERDHEVIDPLRDKSHVATVLAFTEFDEAQRRQRASVERATAIEVCDTDREVIDDDATDWHAVSLAATRSTGSVPHHVGIWWHRRTRANSPAARLPLPRRRATGPERRLWSRPRQSGTPEPSRQGEGFRPAPSQQRARDQRPAFRVSGPSPSKSSGWSTGADESTLRSIRRSSE